MMQGEKLRRADFVTSILLLLFGAWMLGETFTMPMRDTFGGVQNVWYVSPALFPLIISAGLLILGAVLLLHAIRSGGAAACVAAVRSIRVMDREPSIRFVGILLALVSFVYLFIPRVDFFLSTSLVLYFLVTAFYLDDFSILKKMMGWYAGGSALFVVLFASGLGRSLNRVFLYATDVVALVFLVSMIVFARGITRRDAALRAKTRAALVVALVTPLVLIPLFRYFLRVQMPREGGIIELMHLVYYSLR